MQESVDWIPHNKQSLFTDVREFPNGIFRWMGKRLFLYLQDISQSGVIRVEANLLWSIGDRSQTRQVQEKCCRLEGNTRETASSSFHHTRTRFNRVTQSSRMGCGALPQIAHPQWQETDGLVRPHPEYKQTRGESQEHASGKHDCAHGRFFLSFNRKNISE